MSKEEEIISEEPDSTAASEENNSKEINFEESENKKIKTSKNTKEILENGLLFLNSLMRAATNNAMSIEKDSSSITVDENTGEVIFKFKLPGF